MAHLENALRKRSLPLQAAGLMTLVSLLAGCQSAAPKNAPAMNAGKAEDGSVAEIRRLAEEAAEAAAGVTFAQNRS